MHTLPWGRQHWIILRQVQGWLYLYKGIRQLWRFQKVHWMGGLRLQHKETAFVIELYDTWGVWISNCGWRFQEEMDRKRNWEVQTCWITRVNSENCLKGVDPDHLVLLSILLTVFLDTPSSFAISLLLIPISFILRINLHTSSPYNPDALTHEEMDQN